jgi:predicted metal-dependent phosphoesterase TrpH
MAPSYDLHSHSTASDGTLAPAELVRRAHAQDVGVLALTDHDTLAGVPEARAAAADLGITLVPGVEVSVQWAGQTIHVVGLGVAGGHGPLRAGLAGIQAIRGERAAEMGRRLERLGVVDPLVAAQALAGGGLVARTHFARVLVQQGRAADVRDAIGRYLRRGKPGYVAGQWASLPDAVDWITGAGGIAVIAHPARYKLSATKMRTLLGQFRDLGGRAIEVVSGSHGPEDVRTAAAWAQRFGLLASQGSDYHGPENPWIDLGRLPALPRSCEPVWSVWQGAEAVA